MNRHINERNAVPTDKFKVDMQQLANDIDELADFDFDYLKGDYNGAEFYASRGRDIQRIYGQQLENGEVKMSEYYNNEFEVTGDKPSDFIDEFSGNLEDDLSESVEFADEYSWDVEGGFFGIDDVEDDYEHTNLYGGDSTYCYVCGATLKHDSDGGTYCPNCDGEPEVEYCIGCGAVLDNDMDLYCKDCANDLDESLKLNEGPGAGYHIKSELVIDSIDNIKLEDYDLHNDYKIRNFSCNGKGHIEHISAYSYMYGDNFDVNSPVEFTTGWLYADDFETEEDMIDSIKNQVGNTIDTDIIYGGGYIHSKYDGTLADEDGTDMEWDDEPRFTFVELTDEELIKYIDMAVTGDNIVEDYYLYFEDGEEFDQVYDTEDEAIKFAKELGSKNNEYVEVVKQTNFVDFSGEVDFDPDSTEIVFKYFPN